jgi:hypothetical protein
MLMDFDDRIYISLPAIFKGALALGLVSVIAAYALFQARHIISGPVITLTNEVPHVVSTSTVAFQGSAQNIVRLWLNGSPIYTTDDGSFAEVVVVPYGYTIVTIEAEDRYGARERLEHSIMRVQEGDGA